MGMNKERRKWMSDGWLEVGESDGDELYYLYELDPFLRCLLVILIQVSVK